MNNKSFTFSGEVDFGGQLELSLWYTEGHPFAISCYLWCSEDGKLPFYGSGDVSGNALSPHEVVSIVQGVPPARGHGEG